MRRNISNLWTIQKLIADIYNRSVQGPGSVIRRTRDYATNEKIKVWLLPNVLMTAWLLSENCLMTVWWLPDDCLMTVWWLSADCPLTAHWLPADCLLTAHWLPADCLPTTHWPSHDIKTSLFNAINKWIANIWLAFQIVEIKMWRRK